MKKLVYFLISLWILLICTGIGYVCVLYNLSSNSTYYAHHMPHAKGTNPEMVLTVDNLVLLRNPDLKNLKVLYDGNEMEIDQLGVTITFYYDGSYMVLKSLTPSATSTIRYITDSAGHFIGVVVEEDEDSYERREITPAEKVEAQKLVDKIMKPIIASQKKPLINLQWLFNAKYQKRFSK